MWMQHRTYQQEVAFDFLKKGIGELPDERTPERGQADRQHARNLTRQPQDVFNPYNQFQTQTLGFVFVLLSGAQEFPLSFIADVKKNGDWKPWREPVKSARHGLS